jgi:hypothetical protein
MNRADVRPRFEQMSRVAVAEDVLIVLIILIEQRSTIAITLFTV